MSENDTLSTQETQKMLDPQSWQTELETLLTQPLHAAKGITRTGKNLGVRITPLPSQDQPQLAVSFFPVCLGSPQGDEENQADQVALGIFLDGLQDADLHTRLAACEALGQLGNPTAHTALEAAVHDENPVIQIAARKALNALDTPRVKTADLSDIPLLLWQQVKHLWKPVGTTKTDHRGEARFANLSTGAVCRLQLLETQSSTQQPALVLSAQRPAEEEFIPEALAAESVLIDINALPQSHRVAVEDGSLVCTMLQNDEEQLIIEFRTESPQLRDGWVHCRITHRETHQDVRSELIALTRNARGVLSGRLVLSEEFDLTQAYEFHFEPLPAPTWQEQP